MQIIPLQATPSQRFTINLANQVCQIKVYQRLTGLYMDLYVNNVLVIGGVICENLNRIVRDLYFGFVGDFCFIDTQGVSDPVYTDLGTRYLLAYLEVSDLNGRG